VGGSGSGLGLVHGLRLAAESPAVGQPASLVPVCSQFAKGDTASCCLDPLLCQPCSLSPCRGLQLFSDAGRHALVWVVRDHAQLMLTLMSRVCCCACLCVCVRQNRCVTRVRATCRRCRCCELPRSVGCTPSRASCWGWGRQVRRGGFVCAEGFGFVLLCLGAGGDR
jgi:hypothetical protein